MSKKIPHSHTKFRERQLKQNYQYCHYLHFFQPILQWPLIWLPFSNEFKIGSHVFHPLIVSKTCFELKDILIHNTLETCTLPLTLTLTLTLILNPDLDRWETGSQKLGRVRPSLNYYLTYFMDDPEKGIFQVFLQVTLDRALEKVKLD